MLLEESFIRYGLELNLPNSIDSLIRRAIQVGAVAKGNGKDDGAELVITRCIRKRFEEFKEKSPKEFEFIESLRCVECDHKEPLSSIKCVMDIAKSCLRSPPLRHRYEEIKRQIHRVLPKGPISHGSETSHRRAADLLQPERANIGHSVQELGPLRGCCAFLSIP